MGIHTPGPWIAKGADGRYLADHAWEIDNADATEFGCAPIHADGAVIALLVEDGGVTVCDHEMEANGRLIAAAPDLLAICRRAEVMFALSGETPEAGSDNPVRDLFAQIRAVVAKVTGS